MRDSIIAVMQSLSVEDQARTALHGFRRLKRFVVFADQRIKEAYFRNNKVTKLHIACGHHVLHGWLNSEYCPGSSSVLRLDATHQFPFEDATFDYAFNEHMIEHIGFAEGLHMLSEVHRILKPGGTLRLSTPNLRFVLDLYQERRTPLQEAYLEWASSTTQTPADNPVFIINNFVRNWGHTFIYDEKTLRSSFEKAGFAKIKRCQIQQSDHPALQNLENGSRMPSGFLEFESMIFEATKGTT